MMNDTSLPVKAYKGFETNMTCRKFQYEIGKTYEHNGPVVRCAQGGFHSCEMPLDVFSYYPPCTSVYGEVDAGGEIHQAEDGDSKIASAVITINACISIGDLTRRAVAWVAEMAKKQGNGSYAAGSYGHASAAGSYGHASVKGKNAIAAALGISGTTQAEEGGAIMLAAYDDEYNLIAVRSSMVGQNGIKAGKRYRLTIKGEFEEVEAD